MLRQSRKAAANTDTMIMELTEYVKDRLKWMDQRFAELDRKMERVDRNNSLRLDKELENKKDSGKRGSNASMGSSGKLEGDSCSFFVLGSGVDFFFRWIC